LLESVRAAEPLVASAASELAQAASELGADAPEAALPHQRQALLALSEAREHFLELRGLIEVIYADEQRIAQVLGAEGEAEVAVLGEYQGALRELQDRNITRAERLEELIAAAAKAPPQPGSDGSPPDPEALEIQRQRLDLAAQLLLLALGEMDAVKQALAPDQGVAWSKALQSGDRVTAPSNTWKRCGGSFSRSSNSCARPTGSRWISQMRPRTRQPWKTPPRRLPLRASGPSWRIRSPLPKGLSRFPGHSKSNPISLAAYSKRRRIRPRPAGVCVKRVSTSCSPTRR